MDSTKWNYEIIHDNLNDQWFIADLSNKKYNFFCKPKISKKQKSRKKLIKR